MRGANESSRAQRTSCSRAALDWDFARQSDIRARNEFHKLEPARQNPCRLLHINHSLGFRILITTFRDGSLLTTSREGFLLVPHSFKPILDANRGVASMRRCLLSVLILLVASSRIEAACVDPAMLVQSTMSIARYFNEQERRAPGVAGIRGTGWFLSPRLIVTAAHVAEAMEISTQQWKDIEVRNGENKRSVPVRLLHRAGSHREKIAVLELQAAIPDAAVLRTRAAPLIPEEPVASLAYPNSRLRFAAGRFVRYGDDDRLTGMALLEMYDGNDRLVLDRGSSGAAVLDCDGRVVAVVSTLITQTITFLSNARRVSTAWQSPNIVAIPIHVLKDFPNPAEAPVTEHTGSLPRQ
jgi:Trypsin-like peptidase domain